MTLKEMAAGAGQSNLLVNLVT